MCTKGSTLDSGRAPRAQQVGAIKEVRKGEETPQATWVRSGLLKANWVMWLDEVPPESHRSCHMLPS